MRNHTPNLAQFYKERNAFLLKSLRRANIILRDCYKDIARLEKKINYLEKENHLLIKKRA